MEQEWIIWIIYEINRKLEEIVERNKSSFLQMRAFGEPLLKASLILLCSNQKRMIRLTKL
jgi:hypothetical protein